MLKASFIVTFWFSLTLTFILSSLGYVYFLYTKPKHLTLIPINTPSSSQTFNPSDPIVSQVKGVSTDVQTGDARPIIISEFLSKHDSPLKPYDYWGHFLTLLADEYHLDFRLLPAISMQESNLCKKIPESSFNCLGLGIHSKGTWTFTSYEENFEAAAKILKEKYIDKGFQTPEEIQDKYTPGSNGSWEFAVNHFMDILEKAEF